MYLIVAKYSEDAERKRIDYAIERWKEITNLERLEGVPILVKDEGENVTEFLDDLYSRTSKDKVKIYQISEASLEVEKKEKHLKVELEGGLETVEKFVGFILAKLNALFYREMPAGKLYKVSTKKGRAEISTRLKAENKKVSVNIRISGYGEAPELIYNKIDNELKYFKEV